VAWVPLRRLDEVPLHPGLAASLPRLEPLLREDGAVF
jgi:8-oxo-dGTP diphosphatase